MKRYLILCIIMLLCGQSNVALSMQTHEYFTELLPQWPVKTEYNAYLLLKEKPLTKHINYLAIPWNMLIKRYQLNHVPDIQLDGGFTICQHNWYPKIIPILQRIGINVLFTPHAQVQEQYDGVTVLPFPHVATNGTNPAQEKDILYSFVGFDSHHIRRKLFKLPKPPADAIITERNAWHFYLRSNWQKQDKKSYQDLMARSRYALCPPGRGTGTLRFWEALQAGAIPVMFGEYDEQCLPAGTDWRACMVMIPENAINNLDTIVRAISPEQEELMRANCLKAYAAHSGQHFVDCIHLYYEDLQSTEHGKANDTQAE